MRQFDYTKKWEKILTPAYKGYLFQDCFDKHTISSYSFNNFLFNASRVILGINMKNNK